MTEQEPALKTWCEGALRAQRVAGKEQGRCAKALSLDPEPVCGPRDSQPPAEIAPALQHVSHILVFPEVSGRVLQTRCAPCLIPRPVSVLSSVSSVYT